MTQTIFDRLCIIDKRYKTMGIDHVRELVETGKKLAELHGNEDLQYKLKTLDELKAAGAYLDFSVATNEEIYQRKPK